MKRLRAAAAGIAMLAAALLLTACGGTAQSGSEPLTLMGKKSDIEKSYMQQLFAHYEQQTGNKLDIVAIADAEFEQTAARSFAEGRGSDILLHFHNADLARFDVAEDFLPLDDQPWVDDLTDSARAYCQNADGTLLGLPFWENSVSGCYYNKTILDSLGLKPATTQAEFDALCQVLADTGYTPICWPGSGCSWMYQFALDPVFADDPALLESLNRNEITYREIPAVTDMARWLDTAAQSGWLGTDYLNTGWDDISPTLGSGKAVMVFIWDTWFYTDLAPDQTYGKEDFALMPVFMGTAPEGTYEGGNLNMMMVNRASPRCEQALDFLAFCAAPENYNVAFDGISTVNCFKGQTTNIQSQMVTDAAASIAKRERVSTAASKIVGYSAEDVAEAVAGLLSGRLDVDGCVRQMDESRIAEAAEQGAAGF